MNKHMRLLTTLALWLLAAVAHAGTVTYVYTDPQGTSLAEANASGTITARFDYAPYGQSVTSMGAAPNGPGYTGHVNDPDTGLVYMQARYYDPEVGRFLSVDPATPVVGNVFNFNRYDYANNDPVRNIDPTGMACGATTEVSAGIQRLRDASDGCGTASVTVVRAFNSNGKAHYVYADGAVLVKSGNRPSRDNNPGDLRKGSSKAISTERSAGWDFTKTSSTDSVTGKHPFAMFSTVEVGETALTDTLKSVYGGKTIAQAISIYAPGNDNNNPVAYAAFVTRMTGIDSLRTVNSLNDQEIGSLTHAIGSMEGMRNAQSILHDYGRGPFTSDQGY